MASTASYKVQAEAVFQDLLDFNGLLWAALDTKRQHVPNKSDEQTHVLQKVYFEDEQPAASRP